MLGRVNLATDPHRDPPTKKAEGKLDAHCAGLRLQHEHGRNHIVEAAEAIDSYARGSETARARLMENLHAYACLLRRHIFPAKRSGATQLFASATRRKNPLSLGGSFGAIAKFQ
jgi:hypothetical protein